jgi:glycosyltransferase involved in cell wall biosynthesis
VVKELAFAVPGDLATPTGGYAYDRRIIAALPDFGWSPQVIDIGADFPHPSAATRTAAAVRLAALPAGQPIVIDGLAFGVLPDEAARLQQAHPLLALVHHPLALETGLNESEAVALRATERSALTRASKVVATSAATADILAKDYGVSPDRLAVVRPGTDRVAHRPRARAGTLAILSVGAVVPRKGYDVLIAALAQLADRPWRLVIAGDRSRSPGTVEALDADIARAGLAEKVALVGAVTDERLAELYASADLFVLPSRFEGYGMAYAEAIAYGVPVVGTTAGAIAEVVPAGAGILVPPGDVNALAAALRRLLDEPAEREKLAAGARAAAATLPTWDEAARQFARVLDALA